MQNVCNLLVVDDEPETVNALKRVFSGDGFSLLHAAFPEEALEILRNNEMDVIICVQSMPGMPGTEVLKQSRKISPDTVRILMTGYSDINTAISAINEGNVYHYFSKPWNSEDIYKIVTEACKNKRDLKGRRNSEEFYLYNHARKFPVLEKGKFKLLEIEDIFYLTTEQGSICAVTRKGRYKCSGTLDRYEVQLKAMNFFRCHKSYLVNLGKVEEISPWFNGALNLKFKGISDTISVSRNYAGKLKMHFGI